MPGPSNPADFFRDMLGQWEKMANSLGSEAMKSEGFARGMQGASGAGLAMQGAWREQMDKALAAANMPTRADIDALAARLYAIEATLARIDARLGGGTEPAPATSKPKRNRRAPKKD